MMNVISNSLFPIYYNNDFNDTQLIAQVYYISDIADCTVYECTKQYYNVAYQI